MKNEIVIQGQSLTNCNTLEEATFESFIEFLDIEKKTFKNYVSFLKQFAQWLNENNYKEPTREVLKSYKNYLREKDFSSGTKQNYFRIAKAFFKWLYVKGYTDKTKGDPTINLHGFKVSEKSQKRGFTEEEIETIVSSIDTTTPKGKRDKALILLIVSCGLRINEARMIDLQDIEEENGKKIVKIRGKGHSSKDDTKKIFPEVDQAIEEYLETRPNRKANEPLFTSCGNRSKNNERISETSYSRLLKNIFKASGFNSKRLTSHSLRHSSGSILYKKEHDLFKVQRFLRHKSPTTTERYIHTDEQERDTSEQVILNEIFHKGIATRQEEIEQSIKHLSDEQLSQVINFISNFS